MILAIDPGAEMGLALFREPDDDPAPGYPVSLLVEAGRVDLGGRKPASEYERIGKGIAAILVNATGSYPLSRIVIEDPPWAGTYGRKRSNPKSVAGLYRRIGAIGAIAYNVGGRLAEVEFRRVDKVAKRTRHAVVRKLLREAGVAVVPDPNVYDAVWIGADAIGWEP